MSRKYENTNNPENFSLGVGGPLYKLLMLIHLVKHPLEYYKRRMIVISMIAWLPLFILAAIAGVAFGGVEMPFLRDIDVHVRLLLALSMLISAEVIAHNRMHCIVEQFLKCDIITPDLRPRYLQIITSTARIRDSVLAEIFIIMMVFTLGHAVAIEYIPVGVSSWYGARINDLPNLTTAGYWYVYVSLPIFQFILLRWYFRMSIWYLFLWQVSRLPLKLNSLHPDRAGGIGFLSKSVYAFEPFLLAHSVLLSGMIFNRIINAGASVVDFKVEVIGIMVFLIIMPLLPLTFFLSKMIKEKRNGTMDYDVVANRYVTDFRKKWISPLSKNSTELLGTSDIQSLADLSNSFQVSTQMRLTPFGRNSVIAIMIITAIPLLPLVLTMIPLEKILSQIVGIIF
jgi:hypothetical protein